MPAGRLSTILSRLAHCPLPTVYCLLVLAVALGVRLAFSFRAPPFITNDSLSYVLPGFDLARGLDFTPIFKRPPLYPAFIGGVIALFGEELRVLLLVQHLLGALTALCAFAIGRLIFGPAAGLAAGLLTALSGPLLVTEHYLMSETLFMALLSAALLTFLLGLRRQTVGWFATTGLLLGLAVLTRPIAQAIVVLLLVALALLLPRARSTLRFGLVLAACFAIAVVPWMVRNQAVHGAFTIAGGLGEGIAVRTIRYDQRFDFREPPGGDADRLVARARRIYRDEAGDESAFELARRLREELNVSEARADSLMREIAVGAILRQPVYYLQGTARMFGETLVGRPVRLRQDWTPWRNIEWEPRVEHLLPAPTATEDRAFRAAETLATLYDPARHAPLLLPLFALGMIGGLARERRPALVLGIMVLGLLLACAALIGIEWRYRYPLDPFINVLAGGGLLVAARWAASGGRWLVSRFAGRAGTATGPASLAEGTG